jgi:hypothetical protein
MGRVSCGDGIDRGSGREAGAVYHVETGAVEFLEPGM